MHRSRLLPRLVGVAQFQDDERSSQGQAVAAAQALGGQRLIEENEIRAWLDNAAPPLSRVLDTLTAAEQAAFLKAMDLLEDELQPKKP